MAEEDNVFEIEKILESFEEKGVRYYRVRWKGFGEDDDTWEPQENLIDCKDVLDKFWKEDKKYKQAKVRKRNSESTSQTFKTRSKKKRQGRTTNNSTIVRIDSPSFQGKNVTLPKGKIRKSFAKQTKAKRKHTSGNETLSLDNNLDAKQKNKHANKKRESSLERKKKRKKHAPKDSFPENKLDSPLQEKSQLEENPMLDENQNTKDINVTARNSISAEGNTPLKVVEDAAACSSASAAKASRLWRENSLESLRRKRNWSSLDVSPEYVPEYCDETVAYDFVSEEEYEYFGDVRYIVKDSVGYGDKSSVESMEGLDKSLAKNEDESEMVSLGKELESEEGRQLQEDIECSNVRPSLSLDSSSRKLEAEQLSSTSSDSGIQKYPFLQKNDIQQQQSGGFKCTDGDTPRLTSECNTALELFSETEASPGKNVGEQAHSGGQAHKMESETNQANELFSKTVASVKKSDVIQRAEVQTDCLGSERNTTRERTHGSDDVVGTRTSDDVGFNRCLLYGSNKKAVEADHNKSSREDEQKPEMRASLSEDSVVVTDSECMSPEFHKIPETRKEVFDFPEKSDSSDAKETLAHGKRSLENEFGNEKNEAGDIDAKKIIKNEDLCVDQKTVTRGKDKQIESVSNSGKTRGDSKHCENDATSFQEEERPDIMENEIGHGSQSVCSNEINKPTDRPQNLEQKSTNKEKFSSVGLEKDCDGTEKKTNRDVLLGISEGKSKVALSYGVVKEPSCESDKPCKTFEEKSQRLSAVKRGIATPEVIEIDVQSSCEQTSGCVMPTENSNSAADVQLSNEDKLNVIGNKSDLNKKPCGSSETNTKRKRTKLRLSLKRKPDKSNDESFGKKCKQLPLIEEGSQEVLSLLDKSAKPIQEVEATDQSMNQEELAELKLEGSDNEKKNDNTGKKDVLEPVTVIEKLSQENIKDPPGNTKSTKIIEKDTQKRIIESFRSAEKLHRQEIFEKNYDKSIETERKNSVDGLDEVQSDSAAKKPQVENDIEEMPCESSANLGKSIDSSTAGQKIKQKVGDDVKSSNTKNGVLQSDESQKKYVSVMGKVFISGEQTLTSSATVEQKSLPPVVDPSLTSPVVVKQTTPGSTLQTEAVSGESCLNALSRKSESILVEEKGDETEKEQASDSATSSSMPTSESGIVCNSVVTTLEVSHTKDMHPHFTHAVTGSPISVLLRQSVALGNPGMLTSTVNAGGNEKYKRGSDYLSWSSDTSKTYPYSAHSNPPLLNHLSQNPFLAGTTPFVANANQFLTSHANQRALLAQPRYSFPNQVNPHPFSTHTSKASPNQKPFSAVAGINWYPEYNNQIRQRPLYPIAPKTFGQRPFFVGPSYPMHPQYSQQVLFANSFARALHEMATRRQPENHSVHISTSFDNKEYSSSIDADKAWYAKHVGSPTMVSSSNNNNTDSLPKEQKAEGSIQTTNNISQAEIRTINTSDAIASQSNNINGIISEPMGKTSLEASEIELTVSSPNQSVLVNEQSSSYKDTEKNQLKGADKIANEASVINEKPLFEAVRELTVKGKNLLLEETFVKDGKTISNLPLAKISDSSSIDKEQPTERAPSQFAVSNSTDFVSKKHGQSEDKYIGRESDKDKDRSIDKEKNRPNRAKDKASSNSDSDRKTTPKSSFIDSKKSFHRTNDKSEKQSSGTSKRGGSKERERRQDLSSSKGRKRDSEKTFGKDKEVSRNKEDASKTGSRSRDDDRRSKRDSKGKFSELKSQESVDSELEFDFDDYSPGEVANEPEKAERRVTQTGIPTAMSLREVKSAIKQGDAATVLASLAGGMNVDSQDSVSGMTLLMRAVSSGQENIVRLLLNHGANINTKNCTGSTPLIEACEQGFENIVSLLLNAEIDINAKQTLSGETALIKACMKGHYNVVAMLLAHGADSQIRSVSGLTAAQLAVQCGQFEIRDLLESHNKKLQRCVETAIASCLCDSNKLMYPPLLPFVSLYPAEGQKFTYHFHCSDLLLSKTILLFCLRAVFSRTGQVDLNFAKDNGVHTVLLNGSLQSPVLPNIKSVFVLKPRLDTNRLILQTYQSHVHLLNEWSFCVKVYRHEMKPSACIPIQNGHEFCK